MSDDYLGSATTDGDGRYAVEFGADAFRDAFDQRPDLYVRVFAADGRELASTAAAVRRDAGAAEQLDVSVPRARLAGS